ncbi:phosphoribosylformylglycinamidine synthase I [Ammonifex thiophilus]|uniref:Phosphoribosylformylglycinamidine synthase subunit PurQ n=1 Tax=Ammonifex thiophilus TaxID=444093 RepID=A0A3D8P1D8_9THEO|nr:phosphoribosylformylglycinamidine synthase I [Ammonifex thiophilus]
MRVPVLILRTDGTNCDVETAYAFELAGAEPHLVHVNQLRRREVRLTDYRLLVIPGGFTYGDDIAAGKILAVELTSFLREEIGEFLAKGGLVLGICNGFQVLVRTGLLPFGRLGEVQAVLMPNAKGRFECRWVRLRVEKSPSLFTRGMEGQVVEWQAAHGEGCFYTNAEQLKTIEEQGLVAFRYVDAEGRPTQEYPDNPNGSLNAIAGLSDPTGRILGVMPHPERFVLPTQHPNWRRKKIPPAGFFIFQNAVRAAGG